MIYITGDTHGDFRGIAQFCMENHTTYDDILIILGDAGINFSGGSRDERLKDALLHLPITFFCIHGNHERRPQTLPGYKEVQWHGGTVFREIEYPNLLFAKDGEIFDFGGKKTIVLGGAYSIDKDYRLMYQLPWFEDEQPSPEIKAYAEQRLEEAGWQVDYVLSHTTPYKYEPREVFMEGVNQELVDKSTEHWLDAIEEKLNYKKWYAGHFHTDKWTEKLTLLYETVEVFGGKAD